MESLSPVNGYVRLGDLGLSNKRESDGTETGKEVQAVDPFKEVIGCCRDILLALEIGKCMVTCEIRKCGVTSVFLVSSRGLKEATRM